MHASSYRTWLLLKTKVKLHTWQNLLKIEVFPMYPQKKNIHNPHLSKIKREKTQIPSPLPNQKNPRLIGCMLHLLIGRMYFVGNLFWPNPMDGVLIGVDTMCNGKVPLGETWGKTLCIFFLLLHVVKRNMGICCGSSFGVVSRLGKHYLMAFVIFTITKCGCSSLVPIH
jgi:hypothetical protein